MKLSSLHPRPRHAREEGRKGKCLRLTIQFFTLGAERRRKGKKKGSCGALPSLFVPCLKEGKKKHKKGKEREKRSTTTLPFTHRTSVCEGKKPRREKGRTADVEILTYVFIVTCPEEKENEGEKE